jgi:hypothetical protein
VRVGVPVVGPACPKAPTHGPPIKGLPCCGHKKTALSAVVSAYESGTPIPCRWTYSDGRTISASSRVVNFSAPHRLNASDSRGPPTICTWRAPSSPRHACALDRSIFLHSFNALESGQGGCWSCAQGEGAALRISAAGGADLMAHGAMQRREWPLRFSGRPSGNGNFGNLVF